MAFQSVAEYKQFCIKGFSNNILLGQFYGSLHELYPCWWIVKIGILKLSSDELSAEDPQPHTTHKDKWNW